MYPPELVAPMKAELADAGFSELITIDDVNNALDKPGTTLVAINSVCGCSAGSMRPAVIAAMENEKTPDNITTAFAGVDRQATDSARELMFPFPPSSPSIALFKDGELVHMLERHHIEGRDASLIAENLKQAYNEYC